MIKRLRLKFICINMAIVTVMLAVILGLVLYFTWKDLESQSLQMMQSVISLPTRPSTVRTLPGDVRLPYFTVQIDGNGVAMVDGSDYYDLTDEEFLEDVTAAALASSEQTGMIWEHALRFRRVELPRGVLLVFLDMTGEINTVQGLVKSCIFISIASLTGFLVISLFLSRWAIKPVEKAWNQQRQFVADASHELKTPLTVILTNVELLQEPEYDDRQKAQFVQSIRSMSTQMRGLVESLLELARVDNGRAKMDFAPLDLSQLVSDAVLPFEPVYFEQDRLLESRIEEGLCVKGNREYLYRVVDILLDNGAKYAFSGTAVLLQLRRQGKTAVLSVANQGPAISKEDLENIFKRFYRVDKARAMNHSYGLGLSIAQSIVSEHGGRIWAESDGGVNTFFVQLPLCG